MRHRVVPWKRALGSSGLACALACVLLLSGGLGGTDGAPTSAAAGCGTLEVDSQVISNFPKAFASQYDKKLRVSVQRGRSHVRNWRVQLYTFGGFLLGESPVDKSMSSTDTASMKLRLALQPGKYTLVTKGEVPGCGELEVDDVASFRSCLAKLPISFIEKPAGTAADYGKYVSVKIAPKSVWAPLTDIFGSLSNFDGDIFGKAELPRGQRKLIGEQFLDFKLKSGGLQPGGYTVFISGKAQQPRQCGDLSKTTVLKFK